VTSQYQVVVFDWDGTLMDSTGGIVRAIQGASQDMGFDVPGEREAAWVIGLSLDKALAHLVPHMSEADRSRFLDRYRHHYLAQAEELSLFEGVQALLDDLRSQGVRLAVATGKSRVGLDRVLAQTGIASCFAVTRCADETMGKPNPRMLTEIMAELGCQPESVVMVGDTSHDLAMAANAGVHGLGVTYGAHHEDELRAHPNVDIKDSVADVQDWLLPRTRGL
jgi:phosphoglycolate phosphatase